MSLPEAVLINFNTFIVIMHNNSLSYCIPSVKSSGMRSAILFGGQRGMGNMVYWLGLFIQDSGTSAMFTHWQRPSLILRAEQGGEDHEGDDDGYEHRTLLKVGRTCPGDLNTEGTEDTEAGE